MEKEYLRYELKYPVPEKRLPSIRERLLVYGMTHDRGFLMNTRDEAYVVTSLYFDSPERSDYYDKSSGLLDRKKLRIRIYQPHLHEQVNAIFLEKKIKHNMTIRKVRTAITFSEYDELIRGGVSALLMKKSHDDTYKEILHSIHRARAKPHLAVQYFREPLISRARPFFRVTLDTHLTAGKSLDLRTHPSMQHVAPGTAVIELKYSTFLPSWFSNVLALCELSRESFSKYALGLEAVHRCNPIPR